MVVGWLSCKLCLLLGVMKNDLAGPELEHFNNMVKCMHPGLGCDNRQGHLQDSVVLAWQVLDGRVLQPHGEVS